MEMEEPITSDDDYARHRQLVPVDAVTPSAVLNVPASEGDLSNSAFPKCALSASKFTLPEGWSVKKVPRQFGGIIDKYYHDPETGRQFRSLKEVERYISKGITPPKTRAKRLKYHDEKVENHTTEGVTPTRTRVKGLTYPPDAKDENQTTEGVTPTKTRGKRVKCHHDEKVSPQTTLSASKFTLPDGWFVKKVPRRSGGLTDKYYCDPETGRQFRSLKEVERYIYEGVTPPSKRLKYYHDEKVENHTTEAVTPNSSMGNKVSSKSTLSASKFTLPEGWSVEKVPRKFGDITDKYYRDPETGLQFRSLKDVERYISEGVTPPKTRAKRQKYYPDKNVENQTTEGITPTRTRGKRVNYYDDETVENQTTEEVTPTKTRGKRVSPKNMLSASTFTLPEGWSVTNVARISGGHTDKFYRDPETGRQFRSLREVERYISEGVTPRRVNNGGADYGYLIKLLLVGDSGVGKSCLLLRFSDGSFSIIGIDSKTKTVELDGKQIKLQITTAGQERFRTLTTAYFRGAIGILLVYDVTDESSFNNIRNWIQNIEKHASGNAKKILVGNKADTDESNRVVPTSKGQALADEYGIKFFETSAKMNLNVDQVFFSVAADIVQSLADSDSMAEPSTIDINQPEGGGANDQPAQKSAP